MKKIRRCLTIIIISILLFEFILSNSCISYADEFAVGNKVANLITNLGGGIISILLWLPKLKATSILIGIDFSVTILSKIGDAGGSGGGTGIFITPYDIFFNKFKILDINFFDITEDGTIVMSIRAGVANWYYAMRMISIGILLVILIYVGIRMAIASVADEKAKYKKMLWDWCCSLAIVFLVHYIAIFAIYTNNAIVTALDNAFEAVDAEGTIAGLAIEALLGIGIRSLVAFLVFVGILAQTIFFFIAYFNRVLKIGFLILISPLITLTYSIDKMGDGKAQALGNWLKEFIFTILIQPFHCIVYMAFINVAFKLVGLKIDLNYINNLFNVNQLAQGFLAILCIKFVNDGEKIVKKIFGFSSDDSKTSFAGASIATVAAVKSISNMGEKASDLVNNTKVSFAKFNEHFEKDRPALDRIFGKGEKPVGESNGGGSAGGVAKSIAEHSGSKGGTSSKGSSSRKTVSGASKKKGNSFKSKAANRLADRVRKKSSHLSMAAIAGMAAYATGSTDAMTAIGIGSATKKTADSLFNKTTKNLINGDINSNEQEDLKDLDKLKEKEKSLGDALENTKSTIENFDSIVEDFETATKLREQATEKEKEAEELKTQIDQAPKDDPDLEKKKQQLKNLREESKKLREEAQQKMKSAQDKDKSGKAIKALKDRKDPDNEEEKEQIRKSLEEQKAKLEESKKQIEEDIKSFWSEQAILSRLQERHESSSKKDLEKKANQIQEQIVSIIRKRRNINLADSSDELPTEFLTAEDKLGKTIAQSIASKAQHDFLSTGQVDVSNILKDSGFADDKELTGLVEEYSSLLGTNRFAENVEQSETIGYTENGYLSRIAEQLATRYDKYDYASRFDTNGENQEQ